MSPARAGDAATALIGLVAAGLLIASPLLIDHSGPEPYYKGALIYPQLVLGAMALLGLPAAARTLRSGAFAGWRTPPARTAALFALMVLFPLAISALGLAPAGFAVALAGLLLTRRPPREALLISAGVSALLWALFRLWLDIWFPAPWALEALGL